MNVFRHRWQRIAGWIFLSVLMLFLALNKHSRAGRFNYHSEIWSDKAGYYIYLPLFFEYAMDTRQITDTSLAAKTGNGFVIDPATQKLQTKYPYGVALAYAPFYLAAKMFTPQAENDAPGFSLLHHRMVSVAAVFYLLAGLWFLGRFLRAYFNSGVVFLTLAALLLATNLYYYAVFETGMSHVYSFAVFSFFLWFLQRTRFLNRGRTTDHLVFGLLCGWIIVLRPLNVLFLLVYFFLDLKDTSDWKARWQRLFKPVPLLLSLLGGLVLLLPQMIYWKYAYGSYLAYSYGDEGFNWLNPQWVKVLFSPNNGLFLYVPFFILLLVFMVRMVVKGARNGRLLLASFLLLTYVFSCWWEWGFGCGFGNRCYVDYLPLFALAVGHSFEWMSGQKSLVKATALGLLLASCVYSFKMMHSFSGCFAGHKNWDWQGYAAWVKRPMH